jgi:hydrogenase maturation factor
VPVLPETLRLCALLGADPLGLIASGSLLVCCRRDETGPLLQALAAEGIAATVIGEVGECGAGVTALECGLPAPWPEFATDEAARLLAEPGR